MTVCARGRRRLRVCVALAGGGLAWAKAARAQTAQLDVPQDPFPVAPKLFARATGVDPFLEPITLRVEISLNNSFGLLAYIDSALGDTATFIVRRLLPQNAELFIRLRLFDRTGRNFENVGIPGDSRHTGTYLTLVQPNAPNGQIVSDSTFIWRSAPVNVPPGPWVYDFSVTNAGGEISLFPGLRDTVFVAPRLERNTSYRWSVVARLQSGAPADSVRVNSLSTFTITPDAGPQLTLLYQNFPNPFPTDRAATTCIWFDLRTASKVRLRVLSLRGNPVRTLIPGVVGEQLAAGRYGRGGQASGCDGRIVWDGRGDDGRMVEAGVYLLIFEASGTRTVKKILFRGR
jgi:hypothetical protein